ncbi:hypothetical protein GCM10008018_65990 [Paenibacillus marchantiophytorum]|uniref:Uncharacterized protein n=1 Tax=Paenibacillus marchantiophytorum TaxID=1619310 RepID=A0ABQ1FI73_9BACL|nr:hypothetical protein GCM10008018_65990 [Paenibacillus marchantiophytorum]
MSLWGKPQTAALLDETSSLTQPEQAKLDLPGSSTNSADFVSCEVRLPSISTLQI